MDIVLSYICVCVISEYLYVQAVLLPGDSLVPPVKGVASTTTSYSQALTVLCYVVVIIAAGVYYSRTLMNSSVCKRETNLV